MVFLFTLASDSNLKQAVIVKVLALVALRINERLLVVILAIVVLILQASIGLASSFTGKDVAKDEH